MQRFLGHCGKSMANNTSFYFANNFDWIMLKDKIIKKKEEPNTIYIKIDYLPKYLYELMNIKNDFILITGCSDYSPQINFPREYNILIKMSNLIKWYAENNVALHPKMHSLSVGFSTHSKIYEDNLLAIANTLDVKKKINKIFCCWRTRYINCCGPQFVERGKDIEFINDHPNIFYIQKQNLTTTHFQKTLSMYKWCLCPLGNGTDAAPKIIECFFLKTIPIVKKTANVWQLYKKYPVIWVNKFSDILNIELQYDISIDWDKIVEEFTCDFWFKKIVQ